MSGDSDAFSDALDETLVDDEEDEETVLRGIEAVMKERPSLDLSNYEDLYSAAVGAAVGLIKGQLPSIYLSVLLSLNFIVQGLLVRYSFVYVVVPAINDAQDLYQKYHTEVFPNGAFSQTIWENWDSDNDGEAKTNLCNLTKAGPPLFQIVVLWLWTLTIFQDIVENKKFATVIRHLESSTKGTQDGDLQRRNSVSRHDIDGVITSIDPKSRALLLLMCGGRLVIALALLVEGYMWLSSTMSFSDLILNAVALGFILEVDGILYTFCLPPKMRAALAEAELADLSTEHDIDRLIGKGDVRGAMNLANNHASGISSLRSTALWGLSSILLVFMYVFGMLDRFPHLAVLPGYKFDVHSHCNDVLPKFLSLPCSSAGIECFPGPNGEVLPYMCGEVECFR
jgi:hypothetical protein